MVEAAPAGVPVQSGQEVTMSHSAKKSNMQQFDCRLVSVALVSDTPQDLEPLREALVMKQGRVNEQERVVE